MKILKSIYISILIILSLTMGYGQTHIKSVFLEELTWSEVRDALRSGTTTIILPTGGTEQSGPHLVLGKHNYIIKYTSEQIASRLGNTLVAPVIAYVPEGDIEPPTMHMPYPGTITLPNEYFIKVLEYAIRSFKAHGFKDILLIGDSGPNQAGMNEVAQTLNQEWAGTDIKVHFISDYYSRSSFRKWLIEQGETEDDIGFHAGITDTSQLMAVDSSLVRLENLDSFKEEPIVQSNPERNLGNTGVSGNPKRASIEYGKKGLEFKIEAALKQIKELMENR